LINENQKLLYIFDLFNERALFIECIGEVDLIVGREYPICSQSKGLPPKQLVINEFNDIDFSNDDISDQGSMIDEEGELPEFENLEDFDDL
ncbi:MAG: hypothetical protein QNK33_09600, partial [Bacteroidales bacterium]|nr:hypothetical protein [Bacteroidales bacterium]